MKTNDKIVVEYGAFRSIPISKPLPPKFKPVPLSTDYAAGYIHRAVVVKRNDPISSREIDPMHSTNVDGSMYQSYTIVWKISGKKDRTVVDGIIEDIGVEEANTNAVKKLGDVGVRLFPNPLEFWRGY